MRIAPALALVAALGGCGSPPPPPPTPPSPPPTLGGADVVAQVEDQTLTIRARDPRRPEALPGLPVRLTGLWIDAGAGAPERVPLDGWSAEGEGRLSATANHGGHRFRVLVQLTDPDLVRVDVFDEVGLPTPLRAAWLTWSVALPSLDEVGAPLATPNGQADDDAFGSPVLFARSVTSSAGLVPDLELLDRDRRLPQSLRLVRTPDGVDLEHGFEAGRVVELRGESLHFAHELAVRGDAVPFRTRAGLHDRLWDRHAARRLQHEAYPLGERTWDQLESAAITTAGMPTTPGLVRLGERQNLLYDALALARLAQRRDDPTLLDRADAVVGFVLDAPLRAGLLPGACRLDPARGQRDWSPGDPDGPAPDAYRTVDATASARALLQLADLLPERRPAIDSLCADLARLLIENQGSDGRIPPLFEPGYLLGIELDGVDGDAETGGSAWFLAVWAAHAQDDAAHGAARRALAFLARGPLVRGSWPDLAAPPAPRGPVPVRDTAAVARALQAATTLAAGDPTDPAATLVDALADELIALQAVWQPVWLAEPRSGGFAPSNLPDARGLAATPLAAAALLSAHALRGRRDWVQRGSLAIRRALLETDPGTPGGRTLGVAVAEQVRDSLGQALVDVGSGWGAGLDAVWLDQLQVAGNRIDVRLLTRAPDCEQVTVRFCDLPARVPAFLVAGAGPEPIERARLEAGIALPTRRVPRVVFDPPTRLRAGTAWTPFARIEGELSPKASATLVVAAVDATTDSESTRIPLEVDGDRLVPARLPTTDPDRVEHRQFDTSGLEPGARLHAWVEITEGDWQLRVPALGPGHEIRIGAMDAIDVGDQDETPLEGDATTIERFVDGRENARRITPGVAVSYPLTVRPDALALEIRVRYAGRIRVEMEDEQALHEDEPATTGDDRPRDLDLSIADPRRWREGQFVLRFMPVDGEPLLLARIEWLATGNAAAVAGAGESPRPSQRIPSRIQVCVVPITLTEVPESPAPDALEQAFFGGPEYRVTPAPHPQLTVGSASGWIEQLSGRLTTLSGVVTESVHSRVTPTDLRTRGAEAFAELLQEAAPTVATGLSTLHSRPRIVFFVHGGRPLEIDVEPPRLRRDGRPDGGIPLVMVGERGADGSYLSCGTIVRTLLSRLYQLEDLRTPANGNFGALALSSSDRGHLPVLPTGVNLERIGWASRVGVPREEGVTQHLDIPSLLDGHAFLDLDDDTLPDRGRLLLEFRSGGGDARLGGLSIYRELPPNQALVLRRADGARVSPRLWRVSSRSPPVRTPFAPGTPDDLFRFESLLDSDWSETTAPGTAGNARNASGHSPTVEPPTNWLATPQGETPWDVQDLVLAAETPWLLRDVSRAEQLPWVIRESPRPEEQPSAGVRIAWRGHDLLASPRAEWSVADHGGEVAPLFVDGGIPAGGGAARRTDDGGFAFELPATRGAALRFLVPTGPIFAPRRLFGRLWLDAESAGIGQLRVFVDNRLQVEARLDPTIRANEVFMLDLPMARASSWVVIEITNSRPGLSGQLERLVTVPLAERAVRVPLSSLRASHGRLADKIARADLRTMQVDKLGKGRTRIPILLPAGHAIVRMECGLPEGSSHVIQLTVRALSLEGQENFTVLDATTIGGEAPAMLLAICELPERSSDEAALLDIEITGTPGKELWWANVSVERQ